MATLTMRPAEALTMLNERIRKSELPIDASLRAIGTHLWLDIREDGAPLGITIKLTADTTWTATLNTDEFVKAGG